MNPQTFTDVTDSIKNNRGQKFHLLLGNGFSIAYKPDIFSYSALLKTIENDDPELFGIFKAIETSDFEVSMQYLKKCFNLITAFGCDCKLKERVKTARTTLKDRLVRAVAKFHPPSALDILDKQSEACFSFLKRFLDSGGNKGNIYSTNYDLLLYWVLMQNDKHRKHRDGFGKGDSGNLVWGINSATQRIFYLHGMLAFFDNDNDVTVTKEEYHSGNCLLENITTRMKQGEYPLFVSAGDGRQKLKHIKSNPYLTHCYDKLCEVEGSLVTFGFNFGESDDHIVHAINKAANRRASNKLLNLYIGVYIDKTPTKEYQKHIKQMKDKFKCKVHFYNTKAANVWGKGLAQ